MLLVFSFFLGSLKAFASHVQSSPLPLRSNPRDNGAFECLQSCELCHGEYWVLSPGSCLQRPVGWQSSAVPSQLDTQPHSTGHHGQVPAAPFVRGVSCCPVSPPRTCCAGISGGDAPVYLCWKWKLSKVAQNCRGWEGPAIPSGGTETAAGDL